MSKNSGEGILWVGCAALIVLYIAFSAALIYGAGKLAEYFGYPFWVGAVVWLLVSALLGAARSGGAK